VDLILLKIDSGIVHKLVSFLVLIRVNKTMISREREIRNPRERIPSQSLN
jgi:hypothetical protein